MENIIISIITFICGWRMAKYYYRVNDLMILTNTLANVMLGNITLEQAKQINDNLGK